MKEETAAEVERMASLIPGTMDDVCVQMIKRLREEGDLDGSPETAKKILQVMEVNIYDDDEEPGEWALEDSQFNKNPSNEVNDCAIAAIN
jgi:hypothetical protein